MKEMVIAIVLVSIFVVVLFIFMILTTRRVNVLLKRIYVNKLQDFDYLIEEKERALQTVQERMHDAEIELQQIEEKREELNDIPKQEEKSLAVVMPKADYVDETFEEKYAQMKEVFSFDNEEKIKKFIEENVNEKGKAFYDALVNIRSYFDFDVIYKISTYSSDNQKTIVSDLLTEDERKRIKKLFEVKKFDINKFVLKIDKLITEFDPSITIIVNNDKENYEYLDSNIKMEIDNNIIEGFKILYKGVVYDYSV